MHRTLRTLTLGGVVIGTLAAGPWGGPYAADAQRLPDHGAFTRVLERVVTPTGVDYEGLDRNRQELDRYIGSLGLTDPRALESASRNEQLAFWINAYNACMLKVVLDHYPIRAGGGSLFESIRNRLAGYPANSVWQIRNVFGREHCPVAGGLRSQDEIEHEIIRPTFEEPRIHFAVNCAAQSCPVLWPEAYEPDRLDAQLDRAVQALIAAPEHFRLEPGPPPTLHLNKVLDWYREDFGGIAGLQEFLAGYLEPEARALVLRPDTEVRFLEYDWTLNDVSR
jgi:hypothetical protein